MKQKIHPEWKEATVLCNGCGNTFKTHSHTEKITVEICSNCHPFYTGKQKLVDVAGRVDKFKARQRAAVGQQKSKGRKSKVAAKPMPNATSAEKMQQLKKQLESKTAGASGSAPAEGTGVETKH